MDYFKIWSEVKIFHFWGFQVTLHHEDQIDALVQVTVQSGHRGAGFHGTQKKWIDMYSYLSLQNQRDRSTI